MNSFAQRSLPFLLLMIPGLAQGTPPDQIPREAVEIRVAAARQDLAALADQVRDVEATIDERQEEFEDAEEALEDTKDAIYKYEELLASHEANSGDPDLHPAQRREYARAIRATQAHLRKLASIRAKEEQEIARAEQRLEQAKDQKRAIESRMREVRLVIGKLEEQLRTRG